MTLLEIQNRNYTATVRRGLINPKTTKGEFCDKMIEEVNELFNHTDSENEAEELADIITVCLCYAKHYNIDFMNALRKVTIKNENRK